MTISFLLGRFFHYFKSCLLALVLFTLAWSSHSCQSKNHSVAYNGEIYGAVNAGDLAKVKLLLKENPQLVFSRDRDGMTPLIMAIVQYRNRKGLVAFLLANKADVNAKTTNGSTPLHVAVWQGDKDVVEMLLANGSEANAKDNTGWTPLHWAAYYGYKEIAELLLANKADVNTRNNDGSTPLQAAVWNGSMDVAELLRQHGGNE
jgi:ankyrin repeat protein